jgi:hypothetical protein
MSRVVVRAAAAAEGNEAFAPPRADLPKALA